MTLVDWPPRPDRSARLLPLVDTLFVSYRAGTSASGPLLSLSLEWVSTGRVIVEGVSHPLDEVGGDVRVVALDLEAAVFTGGERVGTFSVTVDSMMLGPSPEVETIEFPSLTWANVFEGASPDEARALFAGGFELRAPEILHVAVALFDPAPSMLMHQPTRHRVRVADVRWLFGPDWHAEVPGRALGLRGTARRARLGRGSRGRSARDGSTRSARAGGSDGDDASGESARDAGQDDQSRKGDRDGRGLTDIVDEVDDDDGTLLPYVLAAAGTVGALAAVGGTVGYYGEYPHTPYGLMAGIVRDEGGVLLQAAINAAVFTDDGEPERLIVKALVFGEFFGPTMRPAVSAGVMMSDGAGLDMAVDPSLALGAVFSHPRLRAMLFHAGYDVLRGGFDVGLVVNIRALGSGPRG